MLRWLSAPDTDMDMRSAILMKTFFMGELPIENSLAFFKELGEGYGRALKNLKNANSSIDLYREITTDKKSALFWQMTLDFGERYMKMFIDWTESCVHLLENSEDWQ